MSTLEPNMFTPAATSGKPAIPADQTNQFFTSVIAQLGASTPATAPTATTQICTGMMQFNVAFPTGAATQSIVVTTPEKIEIIDVIVRKSGAGAGNTIQVLNGVTAITNAIVAAVDLTITRPTTIDPAQNVIAAGAGFTVTNTFAAGTILANVTVVARRV